MFFFDIGDDIGDIRLLLHNTTIKVEHGEGAILLSKAPVF
jgi:hypothetical protein